ncbi:hypothetical protein ACOSQ3_033137 [Xanthoceras sorbifolium]
MSRGEETIDGELQVKITQFVKPKHLVWVWSCRERLKIEEGDITVSDGPSGKMVEISEELAKQLCKP